MPDQFDIQRKHDDAAGDLADEAMDKLEEAKELSREKAAREGALSGRPATAHPSVPPKEEPGTTDDPRA